MLWDAEYNWDKLSGHNFLYTPYGSSCTLCK